MKPYIFPPIILQVFVWLISRLSFFIFWDLEIRGVSNVESLPKRIIFASNHSSEFDAILIRAALPLFSRHSPMFYTSREKGFYEKKRFGWRHYIYGGLFFRALGAYPVYVGLNDYEKSLENHIKILEDNGSVCIFPEGRSTRDGNLLRAKGGVAYLTRKTDTPVVPVGISGLVRMNPRDFFFGRRRVVINYGKPLYHKDLFSSSSGESHGDLYKNVASKVMSKVVELLEKNKN